MAMAAAISFAQVDPERVVVVVNGESIKGAEYYRRMEFLPGVGRQMGRSFAEFPPGFLTIEQLITERLIVQLAKKKNVAPSDSEVQAELNARMADNKNLLTDWQAMGRTRKELEDQIRIELCQFKVLTQGVTITDQEVDQHYKDQKVMYTTPRQARLRVIAVGDEASQTAVDNELKAGKSFADVARAHSLELSKEQGGLVGDVPYGSLSETVRTALGKIKIGQSTDWIVSEGTRVKFFLENIIPEKTQELDASLKRNIRMRLMMDKGKAKNNVAAEMSQLRADAKIDIKQKEFAEAYAKFIQAFLREKGPG